MVFIFTIGLSIGQNKDDVYSFQYDGRNYDIVKVERSFEEAAADAVTKGGYLAQIGDGLEDAAIYDAIINGAGISSNYTTVNDGGGIAYVWIGASDQLEEGVWLWDGNNDNEGDNFWNGQGAAGDGGGSAVGDAYNNWGGNVIPNEPDNWSNQDAAAIALDGWPSGSGSLGSASQWNDIKTSNGLYYVIEYESSSINRTDNIIEGLDIYPNPFHTYVSIKNANTELKAITITILDMYGRVLFEKGYKNQPEYQINMNSASQGVYLVKISSSNNQTWYKKIQKEN